MIHLPIHYFELLWPHAHHLQSANRCKRVSLLTNVGDPLDDSKARPSETIISLLYEYAHTGHARESTIPTNFTLSWENLAECLPAQPRAGGSGPCILRGKKHFPGRMENVPVLEFYGVPTFLVGVQNSVEKIHDLTHSR